MPSGTGKQQARRAEGTAADRAHFAADAVPGGMPVRRPGGSQSRPGAGRASSGDGASDAKLSVPPASALQRVLDGLRNLR